MWKIVSCILVAGCLSACARGLPVPERNSALNATCVRRFGVVCPAWFIDAQNKPSATLISDQGSSALYSRSASQEVDQAQDDLRNRRLRWKGICKDDPFVDARLCSTEVFIPDVGILSSFDGGKGWHLTASHYLRSVIIRVGHLSAFAMDCNLVKTCRFPAALSQRLSKDLASGGTTLSISAIFLNGLGDGIGYDAIGFNEAREAAISGRSTAAF